MHISDGEKLILLMLSDLYEKLDVNGEIDPEFIRSAIIKENTWGIPWKYAGVNFEGKEEPAELSEVLDILDMWTAIESSYRNLNVKDKNFVQEHGGPFAKNPQFKGFDGNNEPEYISITYFLINDLDRFTNFSGRNLNAHMPTVESNNRMQRKFKEIVDETFSHALTKENIIAILKEGIHPDYR